MSRNSILFLFTDEATYGTITVGIPMQEKFVTTDYLGQFQGYVIAFLTFFRPLEFAIKFDTIKSGLSIIYFERLQVIISQKISED